MSDVKDDGSFEVNQKYFDYSKDFKMINSKFVNLFGKGSRDILNENIEQFYMDVAASIQKGNRICHVKDLLCFTKRI